jgi:hypothetical protein
MRNLFVILALAGCADGQTSVLLRIESAATVPPSSLRLRMFGDGEIGQPNLFSLGDRKLPATVIITHLSASTPNFRVLVDGLDATGQARSQGAVEIPLQSGQQTSATVRLTDGMLADSDGDGIPDSIDDCPLVADPDQTCHARNDLAVADLAGADFAGVDFSGVDLAQPPDLSRVDLTGVDLGGSLVCPVGALFCDGFESGDTSKWSGANTSASITLSVDGAQPFNGSRSLHVHTSGGTNVAWLIHSLPVPVTSGPISLRVYLYSPGAFNAPLYFLFLHRDSGDDDYVAGLDTQAGPVQWTIYDKNHGTDTVNTDTFSAGMWHCLELEVDISPVDMGAANNVVKLYVDQNAPTIWNLSPVDATTQIAEMDIGVTYQNAAAANDFFIDDVALSTQHIGCE